MEKCEKCGVEATVRCLNCKKVFCVLHGGTHENAEGWTHSTLDFSASETPTFFSWLISSLEAALT